MPWTASDATRFTKKASTPKKRRQWAKVANKALSSGKKEGAAVRLANKVLKS